MPGRAGLWRREWGLASLKRGESCGKLLCGNPFIERLLGIKQEGERTVAVQLDFDFLDVTHLELVGNSGNQPIRGLQHAKGDTRFVGQDRACPAPRAEWRDRGES